MLSRAGSEAITLPAALEQLGLKVALDTAPAPVLVVDSVNEAPTPNPSGVAASLPAPPPGEFDVAGHQDCARRIPRPTVGCSRTDVSTSRASR